MEVSNIIIIISEDDEDFILSGATGEVRGIYNRIRDLNCIRKAYVHNCFGSKEMQRNKDLLITWNLRSYEEINNRLKNLINRLICIELQDVESKMIYNNINVPPGDTNLVYRRIL